MPVEKASAAVEEEGRAPYVPEERRELKSGASVEGIPAVKPETEDTAVSEEEELKAVSVSEPEEETVKEPEKDKTQGQSGDKTDETA